MKKKTVILAVLLAGVLGLSGCKAWDVVCDVLAVNTTKVEKDKEPKVDLDGSVPEVKDEEITEESTADSQEDTKKEEDKSSTNGNNTDKKTADQKSTEKNSGTQKKRVTMPSETPTPTVTPTPTPTHTQEKDTLKTEEKGHKITCVSPVNVRDAASSQSRVIGELAKGDQVEKLGEDGGWIKIRYKGEEAWVYEDYMSEKNSRTSEEQTETDPAKSNWTE